MNKRMLLVMTAAIALGLPGGYTSARGTVSRTEVGQIGRYRLVPVLGNHIFLIDTATGQCWSRALDGEWRDEGNPTLSKTRAPAREAKAPAPALNLPEKSVELTVLQREERAIPGSDGSVRIRLGDISDGQVLLTVVSGDESHLLERVSVSQDDKVEFSLGKAKYTVHIKELRNLFIGDDFAKITVAKNPEESSAEKGRSADQER